MLQICYRCYIGNSSDHSLISMTVELIETPKRGKGFWKFNNSPLTDIDYIQLVKNIITDIKVDQTIENKNQRKRSFMLAKKLKKGTH